VRRPISTGVLEVTLFSAGVLILVFLLRSVLIAPTHSFSYDSFNWTYPIFHFFTGQLLRGEWPWWNPFEHGGEPFYPFLIAFRLFDPVLLGTIGLGQFFTSDTLILFHWTRVVQLVVMSLGSYLLLRRFLLGRQRLFLIPLVLYSSFFLSSLGQDGFLNQFQWAPWAVLVLYRLIEGKGGRLTNVLWLSLLVGMHFQSYHFVGVSLLVFFYLALFLFWNRKSLGTKLRLKEVRKEIALGFLVVFSLSLPTLSVLLEQRRFVFPLRMIPQNYREFFKATPGNVVTELGPQDIEAGLLMPFDIVAHTGTFTRVTNWLQSLSPAGNFMTHRFAPFGTWGSPSQGCLYFGCLGWILVLAGIFFGKHAHKRYWGALTLIFALLGLGPVGGLQYLFYFVLPPLWFLRHLEFLFLFTQLGLLYFACLGIRALPEIRFSSLASKEAIRWSYAFAFLTTVCFLGLRLWDRAGVREAIYPLLSSFVIINGAAAFFLARFRGTFPLFMGFLGAQACLIAFQDPSFAKTFAYWIFFIAVPLLIIYFGRSENRIPWQMVLGIFLAMDLLISFHWSSGLYKKNARLSPQMTTIQRSQPLRLTERDVFLDVPPVAADNRIPRYPSLLLNIPTAFSSPFWFGTEKNLVLPHTVAAMLRAHRWHSYLFTRDYYELIHSSSPAVLDDIFAVRSSPIRLRSQQGSPMEGEIKNIKYTGTRFQADLITSSPASLEWSDAFDPWWKAKVDGKAVPIQKGQGFLKVVSLPRGRHQVEWIYDPIFFRWSLVIWFICLGIVVAYCSSRSLKSYGVINHE
jgi:hypothetical protein